MKSQPELMVQLALDSWNIQLNRINKLIDNLTDEQLTKEIAPGRNSGLYLIGHLTAVADAMLPLLGFGSRQYPELENVFIKNPDKSGLAKPAASVVRQYWKAANATLASHFSKMTVDDWLQRHTAISEEDFKTEPNRNKLAVLLNRTNHVSYHLGQIIFLDKKESD